MDDFPSPNAAGTRSTRPDRQHPFLGIHAVNVFVRDQDRSLRFYVDQLGFNLAFDASPQSGFRWVAVAPPDGTRFRTRIATQPGAKQCKMSVWATGSGFI